MCGIAGYYGSKTFKRNILNKTLKSLKERGPDNQRHKTFFIDKNKRVILLSSRLSIIDLNERSNQPFSKHNLSISFNGEVYNYKELRNSLIEHGYKFRTKSDTEVILSGYKEHGFNFFKKMKGMWALAIIDKDKKELILSRDRFGEKPLYYHNNNDGFYFGSQIRQIQILSNKKFKINDKQIFNYLCLGYRSLEKFNINFFKGIKKVNPGSILKFNLNKIAQYKYWNLNYRPNQSIDYKLAIKEVRKKVIQAIERNIVSDVPISVLLSGGIDSNIILSVINKLFKKKISTFSIIDKDKKYNESELIDASVKDNNVKNYKIILEQNKMSELIREIKKSVNYNSKPLYTLTSLISNKLHRIIKKKGIKVSLTGAGADELFTGYYDHGLHYLCEQKNKEIFYRELKAWKKNVYKNIRNPHFRNFNKFLKHKYYTKYIFFTNDNIKEIIKEKKYSKFSDKKFCNDALRNRMLNELFYETIPPILNEDDQNHMYSSVENRSPFLDSDLTELAFKIPTEFLIKNSQNKYILREAFKDLLPKKIFLNKVKKGFNAYIDSLVIRDKESFEKNFSDKKKRIYKYIKFEKLKNLYFKKKLNNSESMFLFRFLNCSIFLDKFA